MKTAHRWIYTSFGWMLVGVIAGGWRGGPEIPQEYFGMHGHDREDLKLMFTEVPFGTLRLWDSSTSWADLEPEPGEWHFEVLDRYLEGAIANGSDVILTLGMTPFWASKNPDAPSPYGDCSSAPPADVADWENYIRQIALRNEEVYGGAIRYFEVWNEPDHPTVPFYTGTVGELVTLAEATRRVLLEVNPDNKVISPSITQAGAWYLDNFLELGGGEYVDVIGFHMYWDWYAHRIGAFKAVLETDRAVVLANGYASKPMWLTEVGVSNTYFPTPESREMALTEMLIVPWYYGAARAGLYAWNNGSFTTLHDSEKGELTELGVAYSSLQPWLLGARILGLRVSDGPTRVCELSRHDYTARVVWNDDEESMPFTVPTSWGSTLYSLDGEQASLPPDRTISLGNRPYLIAEEIYFRGNPPPRTLQH